MTPNFRRTSLSLLLSGSIVATTFMPVFAANLHTENQLAMYTPINGVAPRPILTGLAAEKMVSMAESLNTSRMSMAQKNLQFALIFSAATKGYAEAQFRLANYYMEDELIGADDDKATYWLQQAMHQGHQGALFVYQNVYSQNFYIGC